MFQSGGEIDNGGVCACVMAGGIFEIPELSLQFFCEL